jgi:hypothetical protein
MTSGVAGKCVRPLIDAHFAGRISPERERALRGHMADCRGCRGYYERHLVVAAVDPRAPSPKERIATGLGIAPARRTGRALPLMGAALAGAALFVLFPLFRSRTSGEYAARSAGFADAPAALFVYRVDPAERLASRASSLPATAELAFAYTNPARFRHLLIYGVDEHKHVYWYYPAWTEPDADPHAIDITAGPEIVELPQAIRHDLDGRQLTIHGVFTNDDPSVRDVERRLAEATSNDPATPAGSHEERVELTVVR